MKVDGLTNDEVKSHLQVHIDLNHSFFVNLNQKFGFHIVNIIWQKYRLHSRRPTNTAMQDSGSSSAHQQFVVVGSIWVPPPPPPKYTVATTEKGRNGIYAPVATLVGGKASQSSGGMVHSNSPATSSCTHTTTNSPNSRSAT